MRSKQAASYPLRFRHITDGIYAGAAPNQDNIATLAQLGVKYVLSLDQTIANNIKPWLDQYKIKQILIPIEPTTTLTDNLKYLARNIVRILSSFQPIYVHCLHGSDRTGLAIALYRVAKQHYSVNQAINEAKRYNYGLGISPQTQQLWHKLLLVTASQNGVADSGAAEDGGLTERPAQLIYPPTISLQSGSPPEIYPASFAPYQAQLLTTEIDPIVSPGLPLVGDIRTVGPAGAAAPVENQGLLNLKTYY